MSQRFNPKIEEMKQSSPASSDYEPGTDIKDGDPYYSSYGNVRNICFSWPEGRKVFLNYAYLISCEHDAEDGRITLAFSTHVVTLKGINLESIFFKIMGQQVRLLQCVDARYNSIGSDRAIINDIQVMNAS